MRYLIPFWRAGQIRWATLGVALMVGFGARTAAPTITATKDGESFTVSFDKGATWACTVYRMTEPTEPISDTFPDGHYAPRHCWNLNTSMTSYSDDWAYIPPYHADWDVWAEVGYPKDGNVVYINTNKVRVHR